MEKSLVELKQLENLLMKLRIQAVNEGYSHRNFVLTFCAVRNVVRIFIQEESKEAERILRGLLDYDNEGIQFLVLSALFTAKNRDKDLDWQTEIKLEQFKNNPLNQDLCDKLFSALKAEQAPLN